jgi:hypothetical protein
MGQASMRAYCPVCKVEWDMDYDPPECDDASHDWDLMDTEILGGFEVQ